MVVISIFLHCPFSAPPHPPKGEHLLIVIGDLCPFQLTLLDHNGAQQEPASPQLICSQMPRVPHARLRCPFPAHHDLPRALLTSPPTAVTVTGYGAKKYLPQSFSPDLSHLSKPVARTTGSQQDSPLGSERTPVSSQMAGKLGVCEHVQRESLQLSSAPQRVLRSVPDHNHGLSNISYPCPSLWKASMEAVLRGLKSVAWFYGIGRSAATIPGLPQLWSPGRIRPDNISLPQLKFLIAPGPAGLVFLLPSESLSDRYWRRTLTPKTDFPARARSSRTWRSDTLTDIFAASGLLFCSKYNFFQCLGGENVSLQGFRNK